MKSKTILIVVVLLLVGGIAWLMMGESENPVNQKNDNTPSSGNELDAPRNNSNDESVVVEEVPNSLQGELKASNDSRRGNYMLLLKDSDRIIYLNTSRDYSSLVGKSVNVEIEGNLDDFRLIDIKSQ